MKDKVPAVFIENVKPELDGGRYPVKREVGDVFVVTATAFKEGHDFNIQVFLKYRDKLAAGSKWEKVEMVCTNKGLDIWEGRFELAKNTVYEYTIEAWPVAEPSNVTVYDRILEVVVDRVIARYAAWYEMFHRSQGKVPGKSATFKDMEERLPEIKRMGFDVIYLPPVHPIGYTKRKGKNNSLTAKPGEPGSPWAIGSREGGHKSVHPDLGTMGDFENFVRACGKMGMEVAIDFALNCSPDHPYVQEHPEWFYRESDGTIKCAENPPKKYEDIYPLNFFCDDRVNLWNEIKSIFEFWIGKGVTIFRVDNPHTKPYEFWHWAITDVRRKHPETIFLAEAFTRPPIMKLLAKAGYSQSYTYFTWRNTKAELTEYLTELTQTEVADYMRGNFFANTPDILPEILQNASRNAFKMRFALAATLSSVYGIYNGFELCDGKPVPGKEEYLHSEKYEYKVWDWDRPGNIKSYIGLVNKIRRENPALHEYRTLKFHKADSDQVLFYSKTSRDSRNILFIAVNLDPYNLQHSFVYVPVRELGLSPNEPYTVHELMTDRYYTWRGDQNYVHLDPNSDCMNIFRLERR